MYTIYIQYNLVCCPYVSTSQTCDRHNPISVNSEIYILLIQAVKITHCMSICDHSYIYSHICIYKYMIIYVCVCQCVL